MSDFVVIACDLVKTYENGRTRALDVARRASRSMPIA